MVEPNKRTLPGSDAGAAAEETKQESIFMSGSQEQFEQDVRARLEGVELNALEEGLLSRYL